MAFILTTEPLTMENLEKIYQEKPLLQIPEEFLEKRNSEKEISAQGKTKEAATADRFLAAHGLSFGPPIPEAVTRLALVLQLKALLIAQNQPVQSEMLQRLIAFYNREVWPVIQEQSLPESQLMQLCSPLLGKGKVSFQGYDLNAADVMDIFSWTPLNLSASEIDVFISQNSLTYAYLLHNLFRLQPILKWLEYLTQVFDGISSEQPETLPLECKRLANALENTLQIIVQNFSLPTQNQDLALVRDSGINLLQLIINVTAALTDLASETFENLISTSEPPVTISFTLASDLVQSIQKQLKLTGLNPTDNIILIKDMRLLHYGLTTAINLTEQIVALAFWSVTQVGKVFSLTPGNLTLSAYYHSVYFVPNEVPSYQLEKILDFTRITSPAPIT